MALSLSLRERGVFFGVKDQRMKREREPRNEIKQFNTQCPNGISV